MKKAQIAGAVGALLAVSALVVQSSSAAFTAQTENAGNSWAAGTVVLTDEDAGSALFAETALTPGDGSTKCIVVNYDGSLAANVKLFATITGGTGLGDYLDMTVERGTGLADCSDFVADETVYTGELGAMATAHSSFASGVGTWAPAGAGATATYRFSWTLQDDNGAQGKSVQSTFTWEAQNS